LPIEHWINGPIIPTLASPKVKAQRRRERITDSSASMVNELVLTLTKGDGRVSSIIDLK
jgi:hypothetical protein